MCSCKNVLRQFKIGDAMSGDVNSDKCVITQYCSDKTDNHRESVATNVITPSGGFRREGGRGEPAPPSLPFLGDGLTPSLTVYTPDCDNGRPTNNNNNNKHICIAP